MPMQHMFSLQGSFHSSYGSIGKCKEPTHVISTINVDYQIGIGPKDINYVAPSRERGVAATLPESKDWFRGLCFVNKGVAI